MNLGKTLVKELGLDPGVDTLARWMAHYIAEQMEVAEKVKGVDKEKAKVRCFESILMLWKHRSSIPNGNRPLERFDHILLLLDRLSPENQKAYYFRDAALSRKPRTVADPDVKYWIEMAETIDQVVRVWMDYVLKQATKSAADGHTAVILQNAMKIEDKGDLSIISRLLDELNFLDNPTDKKQILAGRVEKLKYFNEFNKELIGLIEREINETCEGTSDKDLSSESDEL